MTMLGALVETRPFWARDVRAAMSRIPGLEVHGTAPDGRFIVTADDVLGARPGNSLHEVETLSGVVSVAPIGDDLGV